MRTKLMTLQIHDVHATAEGADVPCDAVGRIDCAVKALEKYFPLFAVEVGSVVRIADGRVEIYSKDADTLFDDEAVRAETLLKLGEAFCAVHDDVCVRYGTAAEKNAPVARKREDPRTLALNDALWRAVGTRGSVVLLPDEASCRQVVPVDPARLRAVRLDEVRQFNINGALVKGARIVDVFQLDLYPTLEREVEAIITLDGDTPEVCHRLSVVELQGLFQGFTLITARVEGRRGELPRVCGGIRVERR